jgi:hypothetical protein
VLNVGNSKTPDILRIHETKGELGRYVALSHRWGQGDEAFSTTASNIESRRQGIDFGQLPRTFQDAVYVVRMLGIQFLWIDSLCIIQSEGKDDNEDDWKRESRRMETTFALAYCTLAATSAKSSRDGIFGNRSFSPQSVMLCDKSINPPVSVYIGEKTEKFDHDVDKAELNQRGWVFQERILSRRTLHFTTTQIYWECGSVIRCETLEQVFK